MRLADPFTFFVDRSLGGVFVAAAIRQAGLKVVVHDDEFEPDARDVDWLREVGRRGWVVLTKDARIRTNALERGALLSANVAAFMLGRGDMTGPRMASTYALETSLQRVDWDRDGLAVRIRDCAASYNKSAPAVGPCPLSPR